MEYQKITYLLDNTPNQSIKFKTKNWVETKDDSHGTYNFNGQIKSKSWILRSSLCDYSDAYLLVKVTITVVWVLTPTEPDNDGKKVVFKKCAPFTNCISETNNTQIDNAKYIDIFMPMYNLIEYGDNYSPGRANQYLDFLIDLSF